MLPAVAAAAAAVVAAACRYGHSGELTAACLISAHQRAFMFSHQKVQASQAGSWQQHTLLLPWLEKFADCI
jgi:hypothetical protein